jgi:hypothetical protein
MLLFTCPAYSYHCVINNGRHRLPGTATATATTTHSSFCFPFFLFVYFFLSFLFLTLPAHSQHRLYIDREQMAKQQASGHQTPAGASSSLAISSVVKASSVFLYPVSGCLPAVLLLVTPFHTTMKTMASLQQSKINEMWQYVDGGIAEGRPD